ncbi:MAG: hypothetical protein A3E02_00800 [Candidatus Zambryskibacteria bacterium RIFCSPHIGHO2_12_FULL_38_34]|uniref:Glycosyl transferase family 1 domain-containing protein n=1 Tax=Candidatus Zambryskibacteria bacterium RIFCSPLOWO2_12_FULL_39_16 TaxID=1802775 RepID=A0A1G2UQW0_9BACT|nr:MAG: hypothetical protein A3D37_01365 [Candidatus Zambryskibacteria bacterium RIFCSPHIGHO2_02_FULL_38_22]OHA97335.1 MAG: hypothetical protein A3E02_00800 [Candidatus Zambryskibacteria bacterium RIFCSPHIGHO2_12_FULL_38_34]OHB08221.1 MAG: hypothetical protein A3I19_01845 [Candidatus Zambryskibacteria bacterium RIFCSPLOWO2_02_FULL_38_13]OHB11763.1 MAG: hypothetical protein A3G46_01465 [Candidatus Zambryskibacteria bacterium RIFCSPLOWO2_12_FULL_39_16]HJZ23995.1 glycosyltransferase [Candidatus Ba
MNILTISTIDTRGGGSKIPYNIMDGIRKKGHTVSMFVGYKYSNDPDVHKIPLNRLYYRLSKIFANDLRFAKSGMIFKTKEYQDADIINCHNIHSGFFNWADFKRMTREKKVIWTIHDLWPITSGCTNIYGCRQDKPRRVLGFLWDNRNHLLNEKKKVYETSTFDIVVQSEWIMNQLKKSIINNQKMHLINCSIDTNKFRDFEMNQSREELGLPKDKKIILFIAGHGLSHQLKGSDYVKKMILDYSENKDILFVAIGGKKDEEKIKSNPNVHETGYIEDENLLAKYYSASNFLLYPSLGDNLALAVLEAMSCGLPIVSFNTCGIPEAIKDLGYVAEYENIVDLRKGVDYMLSLSTDQKKILGQRCRDNIVKHHSLQKMVDEHEILYSKVINDENST